MRLQLKIFLLITILSGIVLASYADRGITRRSKKKVNVHLPVALKKEISNTVNTTASFKGSFSNNCEDECNTQSSNHQLITYQKGNSVFILPVRQKVYLSSGDNALTIPKLVVKPS